VNHRNISLGFTYDLKDDYLALGFSEEQVAEFDVPETIDGIYQALVELGFLVDKIGNAKSLIKRIEKGDRWDLVFNICEGVNGIGREAQVPAILDLYEIPYVFSDVLVLSLTLHKGMCKQVIRDCGIPTAPFIVADNLTQLNNHKLKYPLFIKPLAEGTGKGIGTDSKVENEQQLIQSADKLFRVFRQSALVEEFLPGREFTVGITGTGPDAKIVGVMEILYKATEASGIYSYFNKSFYEQYIDYLVPEAEVFEKCSKVALDSWKALGCRDGGRVDLRMDAAGIPNFIEVNPLAGLNPVHSDLPILARMSGISYIELIDKIMHSALKRIIIPAIN